VEILLAEQDDTSTAKDLKKTCHCRFRHKDDVVTLECHAFHPATSIVLMPQPFVQISLNFKRQDQDILCKTHLWPWNEKSGSDDFSSRRKINDEKRKNKQKMEYKRLGLTTLMKTMMNLLQWFNYYVEIN
jgi:hypothetical protein